jgi:hypothetical protein
MKISFVTQWCRRLVSVGASALLLTALAVMPGAGGSIGRFV